MYIITFYSFKGGVGRSLSLANIAVELAQTGRRVLVVDFDLEAPGLHTFQALEPVEPGPGLIDFISRYRKERMAPDVTDYTYEAMGVGRTGGRLWVMPAGSMEPSYSEKLASLDWQRLYQEEDGFLLFKDLKAQWEKVFKPDYVLIDSRTGHTDVQGICTRQLPDAVVFLFFPNKQNLDGLAQVVESVKGEKTGPRKKEIDIHFVMSNVPELDDEEEIVKQSLGQFREKLDFKRLTATIHRYDSLALVNQAVFTRERPKSRLAKEYCRLKDALVERNPEDRDGAVQLLLRKLRGPRWSRWRTEQDMKTDTYDRLLRAHSKDSEILHLLSLVKEQDGEIEETLSLLDRAIECGEAQSEIASSMYLSRANARIRLDDKSGARDDLLKALAMPDDEVFELDRAMRLLRAVDEKALEAVKDSPSLAALSFEKRLSLLANFAWGRNGLNVKIEILSKMLEDTEITVAQQQDAKFELGLAYIGIGAFALARKLYDEIRSEKSTIFWAFNSAMAEWGDTRKVPINKFREVLSLATDVSDTTSNCPNFLQCLAVSEWATNGLEMAKQRLDHATNNIADHGSQSFSCWRYLIVTPSEFLKDCNQIGRLINGEDVSPSMFDEQIESTITD